MARASTDLIIVGAGLAGAAAAWAASARGLSVIVLEAFEAGHKRGSSHGSARIFRRAYHDPLYVTMTGRAGEAWQRLQDDAGEELLRLTGGLDFGPGREPAALHAVLIASGVPAVLLDRHQASERYPSISFASGPVLYHADAGVIDPDRAISAMLRLAEQRGADIRFGCPAERITVGSASVTVHTAAGPVTAAVAVVAPGAWIAPLLAGVVQLPPLAVTQEQVFHFAPAGPPEPGAGPGPIFISQDEHGFFYGLPGGRDGEVPGAVKVGEMERGTVTTADARDFTVNPAARQRVISFTERHLPGLSSEIVNEASCLFTSTANEDFILDRVGPLVIASACSGHGAKFAPLTGEILVGLAVGQSAPDPRLTLAAHLAW
ncbi:MAG: FAD-dependent oxidoreductase [Actinomycetia bacterium]|nr:FAD-dependent oxidoreductase [Actinomycetes bacterium]